MSIHPTMTDDEARRIVEAQSPRSRAHREWGRDYRHCPRANEFCHVRDGDEGERRVAGWFAALAAGARRGRG
ncbi:MAG: hypothetical protein IPH76_18865 [Xanthomonadales bacterium]|nr:hypothetical protein [Xanthomonadales bacterium]